MKMQACLVIPAVLLFIAFVQDSEGYCGVCPPGRRELERKV